MDVHYLKIWPQFFQDVKSGVKPFEVRKKDRDYKTGDTLILDEYDPVAGKKTGAWTAQRITYLLDDNNFVKEGYVILGISEIIPEQSKGKKRRGA